MTKRTSPPFRADHVGSLLRPANLLGLARNSPTAQLTPTRCAKWTPRFVTPWRCRKTSDSRARRTASFAERRGTWTSSTNSVAFPKLTSCCSRLQNAEGSTSFTSAALKVDGPVRLEHTIFEDAFKFLKSVTTTAIPKLTILLEHGALPRGRRGHRP